MHSHRISAIANIFVTFERLCGFHDAEWIVDRFVRLYFVIRHFRCSELFVVVVRWFLKWRNICNNLEFGR